MMDKKREWICDALAKLADDVEKGKFGEGKDFNREKFAAEFADEVLILAYLW